MVLIDVVVHCAVIGNCFVDVVDGLSLWNPLEGNQLLGELRHQELEVAGVGARSQVHLLQLVVPWQGLRKINDWGHSTLE